jgi:hypothetical protein
MTTRRRVVVISATIISFSLTCFAKPSILIGKIVAYDVMHHNAKNTAGTMQNQETVILETDSPKRKNKYVKVTFSSFGTTQIDQKYFDGTSPLTVTVFRDHSCNESFPTFVSQVSIEQMAAGTYLLTDAYRNSPPGRIKNLECYVAIQKKK